MHILLLVLLSFLLRAFPLEDRPLAMGKVRATRDMLNKEWEFKSIKDIRYTLSTNDRFVPVIGSSLGRRGRRKSDGSKPLSFLEKRTQLFDAGLYPGVEYRIKKILLNGESVSSIQDVPTDSNTRNDIRFIVRPAYKLIPELERDWPVTVSLDDIPWCLSRGAYNVVTVVGSLSLALTFLFSAFLISLTLTLSGTFIVNL